jgi:hypothetical protein
VVGLVVGVAAVVLEALVVGLVVVRAATVAVARLVAPLLVGAGWLLVAKGVAAGAIMGVAITFSGVGGWVVGASACGAVVTVGGIVFSGVGVIVAVGASGIDKTVASAGTFGSSPQASRVRLRLKISRASKRPFFTLKSPGAT